MIEKAKQEHVNEIMALWLSANTSAHAFIPKAYWEGAFDAVKAAMLAADVFIYKENAAVIGFIGITGGGYIAGLFVDEAHRSQGVGQKLLDHCKRQYPCLELDVFTENSGAVRFYQNNGFEIAGTSINPEFEHEEHRMVWNVGG